LERKIFISLKEAEKSKTISSENELEKFCEYIIKENPDAVTDYKSGKKESLNFLIGKVMQKTEKRADFKIVKDILEKLLK